MSTSIYKDFIDCKYYRTYIRLLSTPDITTEYTEEHHILPRSLGGLDSKENLVRITSRKHFIAHYLLTKFTKENTRSWHSMIKAFNMMRINPQGNIRYMNSRLYEANRKYMSSTMSVAQSGKNNSQFSTMWIYSLELKESKKISKDQIVPAGWFKGRIRDWSSHYTQRECCVCKKIGCMSTLSKYCSNYCKSSQRCNKIKLNIQEFINNYKETQSMCKTLKNQGLAGHGRNIRYLSEMILQSGDFDAICIYMKNKK